MKENSSEKEITSKNDEINERQLFDFEVVFKYEKELRETIVTTIYFLIELISMKIFVKIEWNVSIDLSWLRYFKISISFIYHNESKQNWV